MYKIPFPGSVEDMKSELLELIKEKIGLGDSGMGIKADYPVSPGMYCSANIEATFPTYCIVSLIGSFSGEKYSYDEPGYLKAEYTIDKDTGVQLGTLTLVEPEVIWNDAKQESLENQEALMPDLRQVLSGRASFADYVSLVVAESANLKAAQKAYFGSVKSMKLNAKSKSPKFVIHAIPAMKLTQKSHN